MAKNDKTGVLMVPEKVLNDPDQLASWVRRWVKRLSTGLKGEPVGDLGGRSVYKFRFCREDQTITAKPGDLDDKLEELIGTKLHFRDQPVVAAT